MIRTPALALALALPAAPALAQETPAMEPTAREFLNSCASCHGAEGTGAGFLTRVLRGVDPGDPTRLAAENDGVFPLGPVFAVIDGREAVESKRAAGGIGILGCAVYGTDWALMV